jgi:hypothetical protein
MNRALPWLLCAAVLPSVATAQAGKVSYQNKDYALDALPETAPKPLRGALAGYASLAVKLKLHGWVAASTTCCFLHTSRLQGASALRTLIDRTNTWLAGAWGSTVDAEPYVVIVLDKQADVGVVVDDLVPRHAYLADWAKQARNLGGFNLYEPPLYVVVNDTQPKTEFRLPNQVVHQQTLLVLHREFRRQPFWLHEGIAWVAEEELTGRIHAFNHRVGFVAVTEHTGWRQSLRSLAKAEPDWLRVLATVPTAYDKKLSLYAYGFARWLLGEQERSKKLLAALGDAWWKKSEEGKQPGVELGAEEQKQVFAAVLGAGYEQKVLAGMQ